MGGMCGSSTTVKYPDPSPEERQAQTFTWQLIMQGLSERYNISSKPVTKYKNPEKIQSIQTQIQEAERQLQQFTQGKPGAQYSSQAVDLQNRINSLRNELNNEQSGNNVTTETSYSFDKRESPEIEAIKSKINLAARNGGQGVIPLARELQAARAKVSATEQEKAARGEAIESSFLSNVEKILNGDFSMIQDQRDQIKQIVGDNFQPVMDMVTAKFAQTRDYVNSAIGRLQDAMQDDIAAQYGTSKADIQAKMDAGRLDLTEEFRKLTNNVKNTADTLGRSFSDTDFQKGIAEVESGALNRLYSGGIGELNTLGQNMMGQIKSGYSNLGASAATTIAGLGASEAGMLGNAGLAGADVGSRLSMAAAQPLAAFGTGQSYTSLQNAMQTQDLLNQGYMFAPLQSYLQNLTNQRAGQATTTQQPGIGSSILGGIGSLAGIAGGVMGIPGVMGGGGMASGGGINYYGVNPYG